MGARDYMVGQSTSSVHQLDLLRVVAMELQQPLTHIAGTAHMLSDGAIDSKDIEEQHKRLVISSERMQYLLESILLATQVETKQVQLEFSPTNPASVIHQVVTELTPLAKRYEVNLKTHISQSLNLVSAHHNALRYGLINLLDVAIRSTQSKQIDVLVHNQNDEVMITLRDDSDKLPVNALASLLRRFGKSAQPLKQLPINTTLGIFVASVLADHTNSRIHFHSEFGKRHISLSMPLSHQMSLGL